MISREEFIERATAVQNIIAELKAKKEDLRDETGFEIISTTKIISELINCLAATIKDKGWVTWAFLAKNAEFPMKDTSYEVDKVYVYDDWGDIYDMVQMTRKDNESKGDM